MEIASTLINVFVVVAVGAVLTYMTRDRIADLKSELKADIARLDTGHGELKADFHRLEERMGAGFAQANADIARLEARMDAGFNAVHLEFNAVRSDITAVALAVGAEAPRPSRGPGNP